MTPTSQQEFRGILESSLQCETENTKCQKEGRGIFDQNIV